MALRIACDLDGTLANLDAELLRVARALVGEVASTSELTDSQMCQVWTRVREIPDFWLTLAECEPGAVARLASLATQHGWEVLFLTQRPGTAGDTAQRQSQRWLEAHGFALPSVYVMNGSRGTAANALALDVVLDDRPENCLDVRTDSAARALLVWRHDPATLPPAATRLGIEPVVSISDALDLLLHMTPRAGRPDGFIGRLRSALGL